MVNSSLITQVAEEFGFNAQEADDLCALLSEIPTEEKSELNEIRDSLKMLNDGIEKIRTALKRIKVADKAMYSRLTARDDSSDNKYHKDIMQHSELGELHFLGLGWLKMGYQIEQNKKPKARVHHTGIVWRPDPKHPSGGCSYGIFATYSTRQKMTIEVLKLAQFWLKKGKQPITRSLYHPFFTFAAKLLSDDNNKNDEHSNIYDCYRNNITIVEGSKITDELMKKYSWE